MENANCLSQQTVDTVSVSVSQDFEQYDHIMDSG